MNAIALLTDAQRDEALAASPKPRVMKEDIEARIVKIEYLRIGETVTVCNIVLDNGYSVRGESACVNPENYNEAIGNRYAHDSAFNKLWPLFGFLLAEENFNRVE